MSTYDEKSLLFITSTDAQVPQGRNARAQHRAKTASKATAATGKFATLNFRVEDANGRTDRNDEVHTRKRRRRDEDKASFEASTASRRYQASPKAYQQRPLLALTGSAEHDWALPFINPSEILTVATFHVRRMTILTFLSDPDRLADGLRCRQWSSVPYVYNCFGKDPCVDSAVLCIADRVRFLTGCPFSPISMMKHYSTALRDLQNAIDESWKHNPQDILAATQLLGIYEMLGSLDSNAWTKHIAGAETMIQRYTSIIPESLAKWESRGCGHALPMFGDAMVKRNAEFFGTYPWRELLRAVSANVVDPPEGVQDLLQCLRLMPNLVLDVDSALRCQEDFSEELRFGLLDRAHDIRHRIRKALGGNQLYTDCYYRDMLTNFDFLGTFLSALVALDRTIADLRPIHMSLKEEGRDSTGQLCVQLLQLEIRANGHNPSAEVLAGHAHHRNTSLDTQSIAKG